MSKRSREREQFLADILITAVEGGTGYWASVSSYRHPEDEPAKTQVTLHDMEEEQPPLFVSIDTISKGLYRIGPDSHKPVSMNAKLERTIRQADRENDAGMLDAEAADVIVQVALFGEIVYG